MAIIQGEKIVVSNEKYYKFDSVAIRDDVWHKMMAVMTFKECDANGNCYKKHSFTYKGLEYNWFWDNFNSGTFLYLEFIKKMNLELDVQPGTENEFKNGA